MVNDTVPGALTDTLDRSSSALAVATGGTKSRLTVPHRVKLLTDAADDMSLDDMSIIEKGGHTTSVGESSGWRSRCLASCAVCVAIAAERRRVGGYDKRVRVYH
jgi:hypothetical protein